MTSIIEFGRPEWQSHLGGDLHPPKQEGDLWWRWCGGGKFWCVLPRDMGSGPLKLRVEAAPLAPYSGPLMELLLMDDAGQTLARRVASAKAVAAETACVAPGGVRCAAIWRLLPPPNMTVMVGEEVIARLVFEERGEVQMRDFELPERSPPHTGLRVVTFQAAPAMSAEDLGASPDQRPLAFRLFRLLVV